MHKTLITGANGFVGAQLCRALTERHLPLAAAVRQKTVPYQHQIGDLSAATQWSEALAGCDAVIHLAGRVHIMDEKADDPLSAFREVNVAATMNLARQAAAAGVRRFVFVSSVKVNGEATDGRPFTAHDVAAPADPYGQSKLEAECALRELALQNSMELVIVRPPLVYGPGVRANFYRLLQLVKSGIPLPFGAIDNRRSMVALDNLVDLLILCSHHPAAAGQIFMVSDDHDVSVGTLFRMLSAAMGKRSLQLRVPPKLISIAAACVGKTAQASRLLGSLQVDIAHTRQTLDWTPPVGLQEALNKTAAHFISHH